MDYSDLKTSDFSVWEAINQERNRQEEHIELIASENYVSPAVLEAQGSVLTNKYAEGYPGKRYYGGCEFVDIVERLAIERAMALFPGCGYVNVQPHSGSQANAAVYMALLNPGDTLLGMSLAHGGHLTHGASVNFSGKLFKAVSYGVNAAGWIDYEEVAAQAKAHKPKLIIAGFSAYSRQADWAKFREIADSVGAYLMVDMAHVAGLVAADQYPSPLQYAHVVTTTTHKTLRGPRGGMILAPDNAELAKKLNALIFPGTQGGPLMHVIAAKAVAFQEALQPEFKSYQAQVVANARALAQALQTKGWDIVSGGTDNHMFLVDLTRSGLTGQWAEQTLGEAFLTTNKNTVPNEQRSPFVTSGIRLGTPACTTRGFKEPEMLQIATWIDVVLKEAAQNPAVIEQTRAAVRALCARFPVYQ